jgi:hypothetical protein
MNQSVIRRALLCSLLLISSIAAEDRVAVPSADVQEKAAEIINEVFADDVRQAKTADQKSALVEKLLEQASRSASDHPGQFVLLKKALEVAPDAKWAMLVIDSMAKRFQINGPKAKATTLWKMSKAAKLADEHAAVAEASVQLIATFIQRDDYDAATKLASIAFDAAKKSKNKELTLRVRSVSDRTAAWHEQFKSVEKSLAVMATNPADPAANATVGAYRCFVKGEWDNGLPMLALGNNEELKRLATLELQMPEAAIEAVEIADGWFALSETATGVRQLGLMDRAALWYRGALNSKATLTNLIKIKVERRLESIAEKQSDAPKDTLPDDPKRKTWRDGFNLAAAQVGKESVRITSPAGSDGLNSAIVSKKAYQGPLDITLVARTNSTNIRLRAFSNGVVIWNWEVKPNELRVRVPGSSKVYAARVTPLQPGQWYKLRWMVSQKKMAVLINDKVVFTRQGLFALPSSPVYIFSALGSTIEVKSVEIKPLK